jgi:UDP:flavonoid glycosyltransferase YjiC (YdhE family)
MRKIILTTIGTLGDLHPMLALAQALRQKGFRPVFAVAEDHLAKTRELGFEAHAILPGFEAIRQRMGLSEDAAVRQLMRSQRKMLERVILPELISSGRALDRLCEDAEAIVTTPFVLAAPVIAEKRNIRLVSVVLQPMALVSAFDPPETREFWMMKSIPTGVLGAGWNRLVYAGMRRALHLLYAEQINALRADHGLHARSAGRMLEASREAALTLGCYSPLFGPLPRDAPRNTRIVGFPQLESSVSLERLDSELERFLDSGPAPIVFTLGSFAVLAASDFYGIAKEAAQRLGKRAILLTGQAGTISDGDIVARAYVPHELLFPRAALIVHHGGIGTTGQALRAGKPQLVVPHMGDQHDNARRIERLGVGKRLRARSFTVDRASARMARLLGDPAYAAEAARVGEIVREEKGAEAAASAIAKVLGEAASSKLRGHESRSSL